MQQKVVNQKMNDVLQHSLVGKSLLWHISSNNYFVQCQSRDFPTELCCNTIIHLLFHYILLHRSLLHFKLTILVYCSVVINNLGVVYVVTFLCHNY